MLKLLKYILLAAIALILLFPLFQDVLIVNEKPKNADVIIVLSGDTGRLEQAAELYHEGYAEQMMLSLATEPGTTPEEAIELGVPKSSLILEKEATSTYTNALYTKEKMEEHNLQSAIVVSSDYHMQRVKLAFERVYSDSGIELTYVADLRGEQAWERDIPNIRLAVRESMKLIGYWLGLYKFIDL